MFVGLIWFVVAIIFDLWPFHQVPNQIVWKTASHSEYGFSVDYPTRWISRTYGEHGYRGQDEAKLLIDDRSPQNIFAITIFYFEKSDPSLEDVVFWGDLRIESSNRNFTRRGEDNYEVIDEWNDSINGEPITRRKYGNTSIVKEDVYLARDNDMIIITFQATPTDFQLYKDDFDRIISSFRPLH